MCFSSRSDNKVIVITDEFVVYTMDLDLYNSLKNIELPIRVHAGISKDHIVSTHFSLLAIKYYYIISPIWYNILFLLCIVCVTVCVYTTIIDHYHVEMFKNLIILVSQHGTYVTLLNRSIDILDILSVLPEPYSHIYWANMHSSRGNEQRMTTRKNCTSHFLTSIDPKYLMRHCRHKLRFSFMYVNDDSSHNQCLKFVYSIHTAEDIFNFSVSAGQRSEIIFRPKRVNVYCM